MAYESAPAIEWCISTFDVRCFFLTSKMIFLCGQMRRGGSDEGLRLCSFSNGFF